MAKQQKVTSKKRNVRVEATGQLHVHSSFNNIIVSLANKRIHRMLLRWQQRTALRLLTALVFAR